MELSEVLAIIKDSQPSNTLDGENEPFLLLPSLYCQLPSKQRQIPLKTENFIYAWFFS